VESALGHPGKYEDHRVHPVVLVFSGHADDAQPVRNELSAEKSVHPVHLQHNVGQAQELAHPILDGVPGVLLQKIFILVHFSKCL